MYRQLSLINDGAMSETCMRMAFCFLFEAAQPPTKHARATTTTTTTTPVHVVLCSLSAAHICLDMEPNVVRVCLWKRTKKQRKRDPLKPVCNWPIVHCEDSEWKSVHSRHIIIWTPAFKCVDRCSDQPNHPKELLYHF